MSNTGTDGNRRAIIAAAALAALALLVPAVRAQSCENQAGYATITIAIGGDAKIVRPPDVIIYADPGPGEAGRACWVVKNLGRRTLHLSAKPKDRQEDPDTWQNPFPGFSAVLTSRARFAVSPDPQITGSWTYSLELKKKGNSLDTIDPVIVIRPGSLSMQD